MLRPGMLWNGTSNGDVDWKNGSTVASPPPAASTDDVMPHAMTSLKSVRTEVDRALAHTCTILRSCRDDTHVGTFLASVSSWPSWP